MPAGALGLRWRKPTAYPACRSNPPFARRLAGLCALRAPRRATSSRRAAPKVRAEGKRAPCPSLALSADGPVRGQSVCRTALSADRTFAGQGVKKRGEPSAPSPAQAAEIDKMRRKIGAREIHNWRRARARAPHPVSQSVSSRAGPQGRVAPFRGCKARPDRRLTYCGLQRRPGRVPGFTGASGIVLASQVVQRVTPNHPLPSLSLPRRLPFDDAASFRRESK